MSGSFTCGLAELESLVLRVLIRLHQLRISDDNLLLDYLDSALADDVEVVRVSAFAQDDLSELVGLQFDQVRERHQTQGVQVLLRQAGEGRN